MLKITAIGNLTNDVELKCHEEHQAASSPAPLSASAAAAASSTLRGDRNSTSLALMRNPGWRVGSSAKVMVSKSPEAASLQPFQAKAAAE